jgi:hypothetical protein
LEAEAISALLHLGGVAVVLSIAFLGFDRLDPSQEEFNEWLDTQVTKLSQELLERRLSCATTEDVERIGNVLGEVHLRLLFNFVLHLAGRPCMQRLKPKTWWRFMMWVDRFLYAPHLGYFKSTIERRFIAKLTFFGVMVYVSLVAAVILDTPGIVGDEPRHIMMAGHGFFIAAAYLYFLAMIIITLYHARTASRLRRLKCNVPKYFERINARVTAVHQTWLNAEPPTIPPSPSTDIPK